MKSALRNVFGFILNPLERGDDPYHVNPWGRKVLLILASVFGLLAIAVLWFRQPGSDVGYFAPVVIFGLVSATGLIVGLLGNDRAVAKIWGNK
ncbi:hypothetical protein [Marinimicrobium alkaliphilum]|uniref:hypothetical protein n=1 Tax=Marinimicrobium alkaliphilum TaxID=2202654 RepID=UPI000DBA1711|nr:hypothetical protein [Marinimicrobium alkaliphilum]